MKHLKIVLSIVVALFVFGGQLFSQSVGDYRSSATGNWGDASTWQTFDGSDWVAASVPPAGTSGTVTIRAGHTVTVATAFTVNGATIIVDGYLKETAIITKTAGTWVVNGTFELNHPPASNQGLPTATWNTGSTCLITGVTSATTGINANQNFYNFEVNCPSWSGSLNFGWGGTSAPFTPITIGGDVTVKNTGTGRWQWCAPTAGTASARNAVTVTVNGNLIIDGSSSNATNMVSVTSNGTSNGFTDITINIMGNVSVIGNPTNTAWTNFSISRGSQAGSGTSTWNFYGDLSVANAQIQNSTTTTGGGLGKFVFARSGEQALTFTNLNPTTAAINIEVLSGSTLNLYSSTLTPSTGFFTLNSGASLKTSHPSGIDGNLTNTGAKNLSTGANYLFTGVSSQVTGLILPAVVNNLSINNPTDVTQSASVTVNGALHLANGILIPAENTLIVAGDIVGGSASSFVSGNIARIFNTTGSKLFPIGKGGNYRPLNLNFTQLTGTSTVSAEQFETPLSGTIPPNVILFGDRSWYLTQSGGSDYVYDVTFDGAGFSPTGPPVVLKKDAEIITTHNALEPLYTATGLTSFSDFAVGAIKTYTITATAGANGSIDPSGSIVVTYGSDKTFYITPDPNYMIDDVLVNGVSVGAVSEYTFTNVTDNHTIHAQFRILSYPLNVTIVGNGSVTKQPDLPLYNYGTDVTLTAIPEVGWTFAGWSGDVVSSNNPIVVTMNSAKNITATFTINEYTLNVSIIGEGDVSIVPDLPEYEHGTLVTLTAVPELGWTFNNWSGDVVSTTNPLSVVMNSSKNITATFNKIFTAKYRSFVPESLVVLDAKGKIPKAVKRKPIAAYWEFELVNNTGSDQSELNIQFKNDVNFSRGIVAEPFTSVSGDTKKKFKFTGASIPNGDTVVVKGYSTKGKPQQIKKAFFGTTEPRPNPAVNLNPAIQLLEFPMPTYANLIEEVYRDVPAGMIIGKVRADSAKFYGWVNLNKAANVQKSLYNAKAEEGIHSGEPRYFDTFANEKPFVKEQKVLPPTKHDNVLFAEIVALKLAILASATSHTEDGGGFGDLEYVGEVSKFYGKSISEIADIASEAMTMNTGDPQDYLDFYEVIRLINEAFSGKLDTIAFAQKTVLKGVADLSGIDFLIENPGRGKTVIATDKNTPNQVPEIFNLAQNYPNPFNPTTMIEFSLPDEAIVTLKVYNLLGQEVATLVNNEHYTAGLNSVEFIANSLPSGVYFYRITAEGMGEDIQKFTQVKKMLLMK